MQPLILSLLWLLSFITATTFSQWTSASKEKLNIVFAYFVVKSYCDEGLPEYLYVTLNHTLVTQQPQSKVILLSNFHDCSNSSWIHGSGNSKFEYLKQRGLQLEDSTKIMSDRSRLFLNLSREVFAWDNKNELWMTSALRFFLIEDLMSNKGWQEVLHLEADNLLYIQAHKIVLLLRKHYPLAATPLAASESLITASVFWIAALRHLHTFTTFLLDIAKGKVDLEAAQHAQELSTSENMDLAPIVSSSPSPSPTFQPTTAPSKRFASTDMRKFDANNQRQHSRSPHILSPSQQSKQKQLPKEYPFAQNVYLDYVTWLRPFACCKVGGVAADERNLGLKPYAINEMSMLAFFRVHSLQANGRPLLENLPVVPMYPKYPKPHVLMSGRGQSIHGFANRRGFVDVSIFAPHGAATGAATAEGIWDPNSWGQFLGGTSRKKGRDKGFIDSQHIAGQAMLTSHCRVEMTCDNSLFLHAKNRSMSTLVLGGNVDENYSTYIGLSSPETCYTAPFVKCGVASDPSNTFLRRTPVYNLHIHSKRPELFLPEVCKCVSYVEALSST